MYEKILVPLDGSELAEVALPHAEELGWRISSEVTLLQVSETGESQRFHEHEVYLQREADLVKRNIVHHLGKDQEENIRVKSVVMEGYPAEEIVDYAEKSDIDMIIMATHGRTGVRRWALGSVADKVVRAASQPVVLIRTGGIHHGMTGMREKDMLNTILVPLDGSKESETILPYIEDLARRVEAEVILLQVVEMAHHVYAARGTVAPLPYDRNEMEALKEHAMEYLEGVSAPLRARGVTVKSVVRVGTDAREVIRAADELHADLVALTTHRRTGAGKGAFWSVADMVLRSGNAPIMLVRGPWPGSKQ
ncbi:MAG: universal stress protein [Dehalococcoidia bacterium]|nr:universal stress protein [Dehalococcoidia bacterium]